ncbi:signal recognition particle 14 kDa protein-like [Macrosteles quadrilineatus]|uniref:signal recognition particle 14 kDa protein-like n=1 Tax=Macrosteles quadrilineatus TaxID=74068 RepID=UPI0023E1EB82|nr:signal recognition particle 14 kDa protein-like [Macrosteles quadrilineatus]
MVLMENDAFLSELTKLFQSKRGTGAVTVTMKKYDGRTKPQPRDASKSPTEPSEYMCLLRAKTNNKKLATIVHSRDVNKFQLAYCNLLKGNFDGLKKLKKTKSKSSKATTYQ